MSKLLWVLLPLGMALAWVWWRGWARRPMSRQALNVATSLLLLAYVAATAGLGLYWVARQQLPVFDWHYLFGYATVALLLLHLGFNFRIVWRCLTSTTPRDPAARADRRPAAGPGRRRAVTVLAALAALGGAYALGLRRGRDGALVDRSVPAGGDSQGMSGQAVAALAAVESYHSLSAHSRTGLLTRGPGVQWGDSPAPFKNFPGAARFPLPPPGTPAGPEFDVAALAAVLWHTAGITAERGGIALRASPASGALFATELYVAVRAVPGLASGLWHYEPRAHALERLGTRVPDDAALGAAEGSTPEGAAAVVLASAVFRRTGHKYGDRAYRYLLADLGHALENLRLAARACGAQARLRREFDESQAAATLGVDEGEEGVLAWVALRPGPATDAGDPPALASATRWLAPAPPAASAPPLGATAQMHRASSLRWSAASVAAPPVPPASSPGASAPGSIRLPSVAVTSAGTLARIAARRSVRRYAGTPLPLQALAGVLAGLASQRSPLLSPALRVNLVVHAVAGVPAGAYRVEGAMDTLVTRRANVDLRAAARAAALDQEVIGDAAAVFVLSVDRASLAADPAGPARGYRHAFLEAGMVGERLYLETGARGLGACAVGAFYDDEAAALVAIDPAREWVLHFTAIGVPAS